MSDIQFNPNRPETWLKADGTVTSTFAQAVAIDPARAKDWFPLASQTEYFEADVRQAYHLGFFSAIAIEAEGVIVDLNGYGIGQHKEHALMQQFFSVIELSDQPFPVGSGPANFGAQLRSAKKVWIKNGTLGYSSHHNLHGNAGVENLLLTNLVFKDSTVAGFAANGAKKVHIEGCEDKGKRSDVKVRGAFNEIRLDTKLIEGWLAAGGSIESQTEDAYDASKLAIETIFNDVVFGAGVISESSLTAADRAVLKNYTGLPDGISYGFLINPTDVAVGAFLESADKKLGETSDISIVNCSIEAIKAKPMEVMALSPAIVAAQEAEVGGEVLYDVNAQQRGSTGAVLDYLHAFDVEGTGAYVGNVVSDMQLEIAKLQNDAPANLKPMLGQINIDPHFIQMKRGTLTAFLKPIAGEHKKVWELVDASDVAIEGTEFVALAQGDIQHHVLKGVVGCRISGATNVAVKNLVLSGIENMAEIGYDYEGAGYIGDKDGGHGGQGAGMPGYHGNHVRGLLIESCSGVEVSDVTVSGMKSATGPAFGIELRGVTSNVSMERTDIKTIQAAPTMTAPQVKALAYSNWKPEAVGIRATSGVTYSEIKGVKATALSQAVGTPMDMKLETSGVKIS